MPRKVCTKCGGKGFIEKYKRDGGKCFQCSGTGFVSKGRKSDLEEKPVRGELGKKPISNKGYDSLLLDDLMRVNYKAISNVAEIKEFRTALKKKAESMGIPYKYATPTRTLMNAIMEKLNNK